MIFHHPFFAPTANNKTRVFQARRQGFFALEKGWKEHILKKAER
jgi:hypothetical protein